MKGQKRGRTVASAAARGVAGNGGRKKRGSMAPNAIIHIAGPNILERLASGKRIEIDLGPGPEFLITVNEAKKDKVIEFHPWINLAEADVEIKVEVDELNDAIEIDFEDKNGGSLGLVFSTEQARVLFPVLASFVNAQDAWAKLEGLSTLGAMARE